jgi:N-acetylneuraminic acid mutarotase
MKKQVNPNVNAHLIRGAFYLLLLVAFSISGTLLAFFHTDRQANVSHRTLTFAQRVAYQGAIEEVYWRHRIWPETRLDPKPSLAAVISQAQLEKKVHDYLRKSRALEDYWQQPARNASHNDAGGPITPEELQAEIKRMAKHTKQPEVLRELFHALGDDPFVVAECLARPILAERLFTSAINHRGANWTVSHRTRSGKAERPFSGFILPTILKPEGACLDAWGATGTHSAPDGRTHHTAVWTGSEMIVWGGEAPTLGFLNTGGRYNPTTDTWMPTAIANAPSGRRFHTAVWTGTEMIVWGGGNTSFLDSGGRYNPGSDSWTATSTIGAPDARLAHTATWTGSEMIVWGGYSADYLNTGGRYNPNINSWAATSTTNAPIGRAFHTAVWTGAEVIVWGGYYMDSNYHDLQSGGRYNPSADSWAPTSTTNAPEARENHTAIWTGSEMIVWGGFARVATEFNTGGRYNPMTDSWTTTNTTSAPAGRQLHTAVWSGGEMIVWGGSGNGDQMTGGRYDPGADSWIATTTINAPSARLYHTAVWTGSEMIVWGGSHGSNYFNTGGRYCGKYPPPTPTPSPTPLIVTNTNDSGPGSLRQALLDADDGDVIGFAVTGTIGLTSGELLVIRSITISGPGPENLAINGNNHSRVFHITSGRTVTISGLTITNGHASGNFPDDSGGAIYNDHARLTVVNCAIEGNYAAHFGSGIYNDGHAGGIASVVIDHSSIVSNSGNNAIYNDADLIGSAETLITNSTVSDNVGDAIRSAACGSPHGGSPEVQIISSTISGNSAGISNDCLSHVVISNSTISDNGYGIYNDNAAIAASVYNTTMSNNGVEIQNFNAPVVVTIGNSIFNVSPGGHSILNDFGTVTSNGYNVSSDDGGGYLNGPGDQINTNPLLGPLQNNGGPTFTHALLPGSPSINAGDPNFVGPPDYDQRGPDYYRVRGGRIDVGSFEVQEPLPTPTLTPRPALTPRPRPTPPPRP